MKQSLKINPAHYTRGCDITSRGGKREGEGQRQTRFFSKQNSERCFHVYTTDEVWLAHWPASFPPSVFPPLCNFQAVPKRSSSATPSPLMRPLNNACRRKIRGKEGRNRGCIYISWFQQMAIHISLYYSSQVGADLGRLNGLFDRKKIEVGSRFACTNGL